MEIFFRVYCVCGLPMLAIAACVIWKPSPPADEPPPWLITRILWTVIVVVFCVLTFFGLLLLPGLLWRIWRGPRPNARSVADRVGWTIVAFGVSLMFAMAIFAASRESDGDWRSFETIRLHTRVFLALALVPLAGPLVAFILTRRPVDKPKSDPLDAPI